MTREEQRATRLWVEKTRADLVAESGIEYAMAKIKNFQGGLAELSGAISYESKYKNDPLPRMEHLKIPSFATVDTNDDGINDVSGVVSETYTEHGDRYKLRIRSNSSLLNINDTNSPINYDSDPWEDQIHPDRDLAGDEAIIDTMRGPLALLSMDHNAAQRSDKGIQYLGVVHRSTKVLNCRFRASD